MDIGGDGVNVYADAKGEYTRQLCQYLTPALHKYFLEMLEKAKHQEGDPKQYLVNFQTLLEGITDWNMDKVQRETQMVAINTQCDYLEELLTAVFIAHTKVLSAIRLTNKSRKLQITIPKLEHFLHRTFRECARILWTNAYLFSANGTTFDRQKNMREVENLINDGILLGIRTMLPVKSILREYLSTDESDTDDGEDDEADADEDEDKAGAEEEDSKGGADEVVEETKVADTPKVAELPKVAEPPKVADTPKVAEPPKVADTPKVAEPPKVADTPKVAEPPKAADKVAEVPPVINVDTTQNPKEEMEFIDTDALELEEDIEPIQFDELPA